jgi:hypothetical protein
MAFTKKVVAGQTIAAADFAKFFGDHFSEFVKTGFEVSEGTGLIVDISAGTAYVKDATGYMYQIVSSGTETATLADDNTNYVFLHSDNGATYITDSTTATVPDDAILLATVVCASGDVTSVTDNRMTVPIVRYVLTYYNGGVTTSIDENETTIFEGITAGGAVTAKTGMMGISFEHRVYRSPAYQYTIKVYYSFDGTNYSQIGTPQTQKYSEDYTLFLNTLDVSSTTTSSPLYIKITGSVTEATYDRNCNIRYLRVDYYYT